MHYEGYDVPKNFIGGMNHMRTLKKVLALSLVFAMAFTMMAGAAFKDQNKIDSALNNDIQLLTALGVFKGDENGNFNPTANVKRSEAAKMIYVLKNNGVDDGAVAFQGVSKYADVPVGHWAEGYINYCTNLGYMGGWKEGNVQKFDPNGNVTGVELMKMLLCMVGYKADVQGYTGNGWQTNVLVDAATSGLSANFIPSVYGATPRQWTARLMTNAIDAKWVTYSKGELTYKEDSYGEQFLKLNTVEGTLVATNHNNINLKATAAGKISDALNDTDTVIVENAKGDNVVVIGEADAALLGQPVKMYYKSGTNMKEAKLYAVLPYSKTLKVINTTVDAVKFDSKVAGKITVEGLGTKTYTSETADVFANGVMVKNDATVKDAKTNGYLGINSTEPVTLVADQNGVIKTILLQSTVVYAQVDKIDAAKNTLTFKNMSNGAGVGAANLKDADGNKLFFNNGENNKANFNKYLNVASDVKDGSVVKITANLSSGKLVYDVTLANKINASVSAYTLDNSNYATLTVNGETLKPAATNNALEGYDWTSTNSTLTNDKTFYTDGKYVIFSEGGEATASVSNLAYLIKAGDTGGTWNKKNMVKVALADGTIAEYEYKDDTGYLTFATDINKNDAFDKAYLYVMDGGKIKLKALPTSLDSTTQITWSKVDATDILEFNKSNGRVTVKDSTGATVKANLTTDATSFFFVRTGTTDNYKYSVVKASEMAGNMKTEGTAGGNITYATKTINGFPTMLYGVIHSENAAVSDKTYAIGNGKITSAGKDGDKYIVTMEANVNGKNGTLKWAVTSTTERDNLMKTTLPGLTGKIFTYTVDANGYVGNTEKVTIVSDGSAVAADKWHKVVMSAWDTKNAYVTVSGGAGDKSATLSIASDVKIHYVDTDSDYDTVGTAISNASEAKGVEDGNVVEGNKLLKAATQGNAVIYVKNVNNNLTITEIFVETEGMDIGDLQQA